MTVRENIEIVPHLAKLPQDEIVERTVKLMEMVGLPQEFLDRYLIISPAASSSVSA